MNDNPVPLARHSDIVRSIYKDFEINDRAHRIITGRQDSDGHRYSGERCVWCGVNYLDHMIHDGCTINGQDGSCPEPCVGPAEGEWNNRWWPLAKIDALLAEHREEEFGT